ncbi:PQQ-binding-like beta-propeller repeat protein, partial [Candidatus Sumerlaeota bacterium]|nr:PQQ-binding-like beta-propeller repeat protein [Candidatus Sumerlaeota bacterium]
MNKVFVRVASVWGIVLLLAAPAICGQARQGAAAGQPGRKSPSPPAPTAQTNLATYLVEKTGISRGICSVVGADNPGLLADLARASQFYVIHALDPDGSVVEAAKKMIDARGLYGHRIVIEKGQRDRLPYADNTIDALIVPNLPGGQLGASDAAEILRVLRPKGVAMLGAGGRQKPALGGLGDQARAASVIEGDRGVWVRLVKPLQQGADSWSHWQHGPDNNPASLDTVIKPPYLTQWTAEPYYITMPAITLVAGGRTFCAMGHIAHHEREEQWINTLYVRDAYNGVQLWQRKLPRGYLTHRSAFVATDDIFYMIDDDGNGLLMLDPETGRRIGEIQDESLSGEWKWVALQDGVLYVMCGGKPDQREVKYAKSQNTHWSWQALSNGYYRREIPWGFGQMIGAYDIERKRLLWTHKETGSMDSRALTMDGQKIFFYGPYSHVGCLDAKTGKLLWTNNDPQIRELVQEEGRGLSSTPGFRTEPFSLVSREALFFAPQTNQYVAAVSKDNGRLLWYRRKTTSNPNLLYADDSLLVGVGEGGNTLRLDPLTGETRQDLGFRKRSCSRLTATPDSFFCRGFFEGTTRYDRKTGRVTFNGAMRPSCQDGVVPANGLLFIGPWTCDCNLSLMGAMALCSAGDFRFKHEATEGDRLDIAASNVTSVAPLNVSSKDWPVYRANNNHNAATRVSLSANLEKKWEFGPQNAITPTPPTAAGGLVFFAADDGKVCAIEAQSGQLRWTFATAGPIRVPPTIWNSRAYVGSGDGYVYCLEAATGRMLWRFRAAPVERRIMVYGRLCSTWPVNSGVLVQDGVAYFAAGLIDTDGTYVYALDAITGQIKWQNNSSGHLNPGIRKGVSAHGRLTIADGKLWMAGGNIVSPAIYDLKTGECLSVVETDGSPRANRGEEIAVLNKEYVLTGGRLIFSAIENVVDPGFFQLTRVSAPNQSAQLVRGKISPAWDDKRLVYVHGRQTPLRCCNLADVGQAFDAGKRDPDTLIQKRWMANVPGVLDVVGIALASNAVVAVCQTRPTDKEPSQWAVMTLSPKDGSVRWQSALP